MLTYVEIIQGYIVLGIEKNVVCHMSRVLSPLEISGSHCDCILELPGELYKLLMLYPNFAALLEILLVSSHPQLFRFNLHGV